MKKANAARARKPVKKASRKPEKDSSRKPEKDLARKPVKVASRRGEVALPRRWFTRAPTRASKATLEHALLGLIAEMPGSTGYDLLKAFDLSMSHYWHAWQGQIYPTLERMAEVGLISKREVAQRNRPNKRLYTITPAGERFLVGWLESPFEALALKYPPMLRCRFLGNLGVDGAIEILKEERLQWENILRVYRGIEREHFSGKKGYSNVNAMFSWFTLKRGIDWMEENIRWCDWAMAEVERNRGLFPAVDMRAGLKPIISFEESQAQRYPPRVSFEEAQRRHAGDGDDEGRGGNRG